MPRPSVDQSELPCKSVQLCEFTQRAEGNKFKNNKYKKMSANDEHWQLGSWIERNKYLLKTGHLADYTIIVKKGKKVEKIPCHKYVLAQVSDVFYSMMFKGELSKVHFIKDVSPEHAKKMLEFMYTDEVELGDVKTALRVCHAANKFGVMRLIKLCCAFIRENLSATSVCECFEFFHSAGIQELENVCVEFLVDNIQKVIEGDNLSLVGRSTLVKILENDELEIESEAALFAACVKWAQKNKKDNATLRGTLGPILQLIRFRNFSVQEFASIVVPTSILTPDEACGIMCCLAVDSAIMPTGFTSVKKRRNIDWADKKILTLCFSWNEVTMAHVTGGFLSLAADALICIFGVQVILHNSTVLNNVEVNITAEGKESKRLFASVSKKCNVTFHEDVLLDLKFDNPFTLFPGETVNFTQSCTPEPNLYSHVLQNRSPSVSGVTFTLTAAANNDTRITQVYFAQRKTQR